MSQIPEEIQENQIVSVTREAYSRASSLSSMVITLIWSQFSLIPNSNSDATWTRLTWLTKIHISDAIITDLSTPEFTWAHLSSSLVTCMRKSANSDLSWQRVVKASSLPITLWNIFISFKVGRSFNSPASTQPSISHRAPYCLYLRVSPLPSPAQQTMILIFHLTVCDTDSTDLKSRSRPTLKIYG